MFELNTADGLDRCVLGDGHSVFSDVPPAVVERLDMGYELRKDMLAGQQVGPGTQVMWLPNEVS